MTDKNYCALDLSIGRKRLRTCSCAHVFCSCVFRDKNHAFSILTAVKYFAINDTSFNIISDSNIVHVPVLQVDSWFGVKPKVRNSKLAGVFSSGNPEFKLLKWKPLSITLQGGSMVVFNPKLWPFKWKLQSISFCVAVYYAIQSGSNSFVWFIKSVSLPSRSFRLS